MKPSRTWFWNWVLESHRLSSARVCLAPVFRFAHTKENRDAHRWAAVSETAFFFFRVLVRLLRDFARSRHQKFVSQVESLTTSHNCSQSLSQRLKSEERLWKRQGLTSLWQDVIDYCEPCWCTNLLSHNWKSQRGPARGLQSCITGHARDRISPTSVTFTRLALVSHTYNKLIYMQINGRNNSLETCTKTS